MYVSNLHDYGHLLNADTYDTSKLHGDMYQMFENSLVRVFARGGWKILLVIYCLLAGLGEEVHSSKLDSSVAREYYSSAGM